MAKCLYLNKECTGTKSAQCFNCLLDEINHYREKVKALEEYVVKMQQSNNMPYGDDCYCYGDKVRDQVTGYVGRVTARCSYFGNRMTQYLVEGIDSTGRPIEQWCDSARLALFKEEK